MSFRNLLHPMNVPARSATCTACGRRVRICIPKGGDGSVDVYVRHKTPHGLLCRMSRCEVSPNDQGEP